MSDGQTFGIDAHTSVENSFSVSNLNALVDAQETKITELKGVLEEQFNNFASICDNNWIGPDEVQFKKLILKDINSLYENCDILKTTSCQFMTNAVIAYQSFQNDNASKLIEVSTGVSTSQIPGVDSYVTGNVIDEYQPKALAKLEITVADYTDSNDQKRGLVNNNSAYSISQSIGEFQTNVKSKITEFETLQDSSKVFCSSTVEGDSDLGIDAFLREIANSMGKFTKDLTDFVDNYLPGLVAGYNSQSATISEKATTTSEEVKEKVDTAVSGTSTGENG